MLAFFISESLLQAIFKFDIPPAIVLRQVRISPAV